MLWKTKREDLVCDSMEQMEQSPLRRPGERIYIVPSLFRALFVEMEQCKPAPQAA